MATKKLTTLTIDLQANANQHNAQMEKARTKVRQYATSAKAANDASHKMADGFGAAANQASVIYGPLNGISGRLSAISTGLRAVGAAGFIGAAGLSVMTTGVFNSLSLYREWEQRQLRMQGLLKATGNASGLTANQLDELARSVALNTLGSVEGMGDAVSVLLTFKTVQQDVFTEAIKLSADLAAVMGTDAKSAATQLGKALEDPATGLNALKRSGISFSETEKEVIKDLQETNRLADAQKLILEKLADQVGGAGSSEASGLSGALDTLGQRYDEFLFDLAETTRLGSGATRVINLIAQGIHNFGQDIMPDDQVRLNELTATRLRLKKEIKEMNELGGLQALPSLNPIGYSKNDWYNTQREYSAVAAEMREIQDRAIAEVKKRDEANKAAAKAREQFEKEQADARTKAEKDRLRKQKEVEDRQRTQKLQADQLASASYLNQIELQFAGEQQALALQHQQRLEKIQALQLSEQEIKARGFESLKQLQAHYELQSMAQYEQQQQLLEQRVQQEQDKATAREQSKQLREDERALSDLDRIRQQLMSKEMVELEARERRQATINDAFQRELIGEQQFQDLSLSNWRSYEERLKELEEQKAKERRGTTARLMGDMTELFGAFAGKQSGIYRAMFLAQKAYSLASVIMDNKVALGKAWASAPFPANLPAVAMAAAQTGVLSAAVSAVNLQGMAHSGHSNIPKEGTWLLDGGERVVAPEQNRDLTQFLSQQKGGGSVPNVQIINKGPPATAQASMLDDGTLQIILESVDADQAEKTARGTGLAAQTAERTYGLNRAMGVG